MVELLKWLKYFKTKSILLCVGPFCSVGFVFAARLLDADEEVGRQLQAYYRESIRKTCIVCSISQSKYFPTAALNEEHLSRNAYSTNTRELLSSSEYLEFHPYFLSQENKGKA